MPETARLAISEFPTRPTQLLTASTGWIGINFREVLQSHELLLSLAWRDIRARYKQTILGLFWVIFQPLLAAGIFSFVFTLVADLKAPGGVPYFLFTFTGLLAWNTFSNVLSRSSGVLISNAALVSKIYFPRLVLPISSVLTTLFDFLVVLCLLIVLVIAFWHLPHASVLLAPVCLTLLVALALGMGLCIAAVAVSYRDALYMLPVFTQFLMWGSVVFFPPEEVPARFQGILYLNPLVSLVDGFRWSVLGVGQVRWGYFAYSAVFVAITLAFGLFAFRRMERKFADVI